MTSMTQPTLARGPATGRPYSVADLDAMPDDGRRRELVDGMLVVTPAPGWSHQHAVGELFVLLRAAAPHGVEVILGPYDVRFAAETNLEPDLLVARTSDLTERHLTGAPLLAVEVRSPSTATLDRTFKRAVYERYGTMAYWIVDPDPGEPSLTAFVLGSDGRYDAGTRVTGPQEYRATVPFPVTVRPADLVMPA